MPQQQAPKYSSKGLKIKWLKAEIDDRIPTTNPLPPSSRLQAEPNISAQVSATVKTLSPHI